MKVLELGGGDCDGEEGTGAMKADAGGNGCEVVLRWL